MNDNRKSGFIDRAVLRIKDILNSDNKAMTPNTRAEVRAMLKGHGGYGRLRMSRGTQILIQKLHNGKVIRQQLSKRPVRYFGTFRPVNE